MRTLQIATPNKVADIQKLLRETWQATYSDHLSPATLDEVYKKRNRIDV